MQFVRKVAELRASESRIVAPAKLAQLYPTIIIKTRIISSTSTHLPSTPSQRATMSMSVTTDGGDSMRRSAVRNPKRRPRKPEESNSPSGPQRKIRRLNKKHDPEPQSLPADTTESLRSGLSALAVQSSASFSRTGDVGARHKRSPKSDNSTLLVSHPPNLLSSCSR